MAELPSEGPCDRGDNWVGNLSSGFEKTGEGQSPACENIAIISNQRCIRLVD